MWIFLIIVALIAIWLISMFNSLVILKNRVDESASDIDVQLKRRHDLIPNLVNTVKGYAQHENDLFTRVTEARSNAVAAGQGDMQQKAQAENMLSSTLRSLFAVAENYPELKANQNFLALQEELSDTENKVMAARRFYNTNVRDYNIRRETFPTNMFAAQFNFTKRELFELEDIKEKEVPNVDFSTNTPAAPMHNQMPAEEKPAMEPEPMQEDQDQQ
ncbi:MAG: LemA family protein [Patescibacteria group bacterium]